MKKNRKKNKVFLVLIAIITLVLGYALLSQELDINGVAGINKHTWDIHWDDTSVEESTGSITATTPAYVSDQEKKIVTFGVELELPGDYYEFTVDAKNYGDIDGLVKEFKVGFYQADGVTPTSISNCLEYSFTHADDSEILPNEVIEVGKSKSYKFRLKYKDNASLTCTASPIISLEMDITQPTQDQYKVTFDPDGGEVSETVRYVNKNTAINTLPVPTKTGVNFGGWYLGETLIDANYVPTSNVTLKAHWDEVLPMFDTGKNVNAKMKALAGNTMPEEDSYTVTDSYIMHIQRSLEEPTAENKTEKHIISAPDSQGEIYAWFDSSNYTIYWWSAGTREKLNPDSSDMFYNLINVRDIDTSFDTSTSTNMSYMFANTRSLDELDLRTFDTSHVTNMIAMFNGNYTTHLDLTSFDTSNVTNMTAMFCQHNSSNGTPTVDLSSFNTSNVEHMEAMFSGSTYPELDLSNFDTHNVVQFAGIFNNCGYSLRKLDVSNWDFSQVDSLTGVFSNLNYLENIYMYNVNTSSIKSLQAMFYGDNALGSVNLSDFDTSNVTNFSAMFQNCNNLKSINVSNWSFASCHDLTTVFGNISYVEEIILNNVDTTGVTSMTAMFYNDYRLKKLVLDDFDTSSVTSMPSMFENNYNLTTISVDENKFVVDQVTVSGNMFKSCSSLVGGNGTRYDSSKLDKEYAHYDHSSPNPGYFNKGDIPAHTVTFNANGGNVTETTRSVIEGKTVGNLPTATKDDASLVGWYTGVTEGVQIDRNEVVTGDVTYYAKWDENKAVTYNGNGGVFEDNTNTNLVDYTYTAGSITRYSHTPNINDNGVVNGTYDSNMSRNDVVTIEGATRLNIEVWYSTEDAIYDWLAIYPEGYTPNNNNYYSADISRGRLGGGQSLVKPTDSLYHKTFTVYGDTVQFYFKSNNSNNYYGYYAIITADGNSFVGNPNYQIPVNRGYRFEGWSDTPGGTVLYQNESSVINDMVYLPTSKTLYANWYEVPEYTVTINPNGGEVDTTSKTIYEGEAIGNLPTPTRTNYQFTGWVSDLTLETPVSEDMVPNANITVYATWKVDFGSAPWSFIEDIIEESDHDYCSYFKVGDTREIELTNYGTHTIRIANCSYSAEFENNTDKSQTANGLVIEFADLIINHRMNPYDKTQYRVNGYGNKGGWEYSEMRTFVNNDIYNELPSEIRNSIINTRAISGYNTEVGDTARFNTTDKLYLLAAYEVYGTNYSPAGANSAQQVDNVNGSQTRTLDYYRGVCGTSGNCVYTRKGLPSKKNTSYPYDIWWLRGATMGLTYTNAEDDNFTTFSTSSIYSGQSMGHLSNNFSHADYVYVSPAFRIGN